MLIKVVVDHREALCRSSRDPAYRSADRVSLEPEAQSSLWGVLVAGFTDTAKHFVRIPNSERRLLLIVDISIPQSSERYE